jgi:hypothetical protein
MAIVGIGRYVVRGIAGTVSITALVATTDNKVQSLTYKKSFGVTEHRDGMGSVWAVTAGEPVEEIQVTLTPVSISGTNSLANAKVSVAVPDPLGVVAIAGFPGAIASGDYTYVDGDIRLSSDGTAEIQCVIRKYAALTSVTPTAFS